MNDTPPLTYTDRAKPIASKYDARLAHQTFIHQTLTEGLKPLMESNKFEKFDKRVWDKIKALLPNYLLVRNGGTMTDSFQIYQAWNQRERGLPQLSYDERFFLCWSESDGWKKGLADALEILNPADTIERDKQEESLIAEFEQLNAEIARFRERARKAVESLPIPSSATRRKAAHFWDRPSARLRKKFPFLLGELEQTR